MKQAVGFRVYKINLPPEWKTHPVVLVEQPSALEPSEDLYHCINPVSEQSAAVKDERND